LPELKLVPLSELKLPVEVELRKALPVYSKALSSGKFEGAIAYEKSSKVVVTGFEEVYALRLLSADYAPAFEVDANEVSSEPPLSDVVKAGLAGPKLPRDSVKVAVASPLPAVSVDLERLYTAKAADSKSAARVYESPVELLYKGWPTPLVKLRSLSSGSKQVWAKLECYNPFSNSVKDRVAWYMVLKAVEEGRMATLLYEATSTNTGIALAALANVVGARAKLFLPQTVQKASDTVLKALGAEVVRLPVSLTVEAINTVKELAKRDGALNLNQFENDANLEVHLKYTARELDEQLRVLGAAPSCIVGGLGTSGHMSAIAIYFKSKYGGRVKVVGVQPAQGSLIPGIRRRETGMKWVEWPEVQVDEVVDVSLDEAIEGVLYVARKEGLFIGLSSGAVVAGYLKACKDLSGVHVLVFPDSGYKYVEQLEAYFERRSAAPPCCE